jgi:hypothetical protein
VFQANGAPQSWPTTTAALAQGVEQTDDVTGEVEVGIGLDRSALGPAVPAGPSDGMEARCGH